MTNKWVSLIAGVLMVVAFATDARCQAGMDSSYQTDNDSAAIDAAIATFYQTLFFTSVDQNKYSNLPRLFTTQGVLISAAGDKPYFWTVQQYVQLAADNFKKQKMETWGEQETCSQTHIFGKIAQRFSTYKILYVAGGAETIRSGINAIQLIKENSKWLIASVAWDRASDTLPIPPEYSCRQVQNEAFVQ
jgi:hypothetical protein